LPQQVVVEVGCCGLMSAHTAAALLLLLLRHHQG
jgi:hypothetical protein